MLGGSFQIDPVNSVALTQLLPERIHIRSVEGDTGRLARVISLITESRWRMMLAQDALRHDAKSLDQLADELGFKSTRAFSTAFRRRTGCAPGGFARSLRSVST
jgi:AraC-like DNA-binding protein